MRSNYQFCLVWRAAQKTRRRKRKQLKRPHEHCNRSTWRRKFHLPRPSPITRPRRQSAIYRAFPLLWRTAKRNNQNQPQQQWHQRNPCQTLISICWIKSSKRQTQTANTAAAPPARLPVVRHLHNETHTIPWHHRQATMAPRTVAHRPWSMINASLAIDVTITAADRRHLISSSNSNNPVTIGAISSVDRDPHPLGNAAAAMSRTIETSHIDDPNLAITIGVTPVDDHDDAHHPSLFWFSSTKTQFNYMPQVDDRARYLFILYRAETSASNTQKGKTWNTHYYWCYCPTAFDFDLEFWDENRNKNSLFSIYILYICIGLYYSKIE